MLGYLHHKLAKHFLLYLYNNCRSFFDDSYRYHLVWIVVYCIDYNRRTSGRYRHDVCLVLVVEKRLFQANMAHQHPEPRKKFIIGNY